MARTICLAAVLAAAVSLTTTAGTAQSRYDDCNDGGRSRQARYCEVRESTMPGVNPIDVDASPNGGISIRGWDRAEAHVRARIQTYADTMAEAQALASAVRIEATGTIVRSDGPSQDRDNGRNWSVSFEIQVPRTAMITLHTVNGGISIQDFRGTAKFTTRNGGVTLADVGGDIKGETSNGGLTVDLRGDRWDGAGLDVETHNGGVKVSVPENYSAVLETSTVNGRVSIDFPVTVSGSIGRQLTTTLGSGGAKIKATTVNGGVTIRRR